MNKFISFFFFLFLILNNCSSATLSELRNDIRQKIGDCKTDTTNRHWSDATLNFRINLVQEYIAKETHCLQARISTRTFAEQREYSYNSDVIEPIRIAYMVNSTSATIYISTAMAWKRLEYWTVAGLDKDIQGWESAAVGLPIKYYERGSKYGLYPTPSAVYASTWAVQIDYYKKPNSLTVDTTAPFDEDVLLSPYHELLIKGVTIMCKEDDRIDTSTMKQEYYLLIGKMGADVKIRQDRQGGFSVR